MTSALGRLIHLSSPVILRDFCEPPGFESYRFESESAWAVVNRESGRLPSTSARGKCDDAESFPFAVYLPAALTDTTTSSPHRNNQHSTRVLHLASLSLLSLRLLLCSCDRSLCLRKRADLIAVDTSTSKTSSQLNSTRSSA